MDASLGSVSGVYSKRVYKTTLFVFTKTISGGKGQKDSRVSKFSEDKSIIR